MAKTKTNGPTIILSGSRQPYLSIGVRFGGIKAFGSEYVYLPEHDAFLRKDEVRRYKKHIKERKSWESFVEMIKSE